MTWMPVFMFLGAFGGVAFAIWDTTLFRIEMSATIRSILERRGVRIVRAVDGTGYVKSILTCNACGARDCAVGRGRCLECIEVTT